ncbi:MAG: hypothetical protein LBD80_00790 [Tannerella sp.]|jgi:hypothetical protein|nr:hypothetical protein [Tannerella sp.]
MRTAEKIWADYLDIISQMEEATNDGVSLYHMDGMRSAIHAELNQYYGQLIGTYAGGFNPEALKEYTNNLDKLIRYLEGFNWGGQIYEKISRYFNTQYGCIMISKIGKGYESN